MGMSLHHGEQTYTFLSKLKKKTSMLLLLLLVFKPTGISTKPSPAKKDQIANFNTLPTFPPLLFTTGPSLEQLHTKNRFFVPLTGLQRHKKKNTRRPKDNVFPTFLLTTTPPRQHHTSLTYRGVSRPLVELLRTQLKKNSLNIIFPFPSEYGKNKHVFLFFSLRII